MKTRDAIIAVGKWVGLKDTSTDSIRQELHSDSGCVRILKRFMQDDSIDNMLVMKVGMIGTPSKERYHLSCDKLYGRSKTSKFIKLLRDIWYRISGQQWNWITVAVAEHKNFNDAVLLLAIDYLDGNHNKR